MINPSELLSAARATNIPAGWSGLWFVKKLQLVTDQQTTKGDLVPAAVYTCLFRMTTGTMHCDPPGVVVMEDTPVELKKHLQFMFRAQGDVLVTGLGLGCVVRGLLANPNVEHVTCIEKSPDVLKLVQSHMPATDRLTIIQADALEWTAANTMRFDYAWHDLWSNREDGEPHLDLWHTRLIFNCTGKVDHQGAWGYARVAKRLLARRRMVLVG